MTKIEDDAKEASRKGWQRGGGGRTKWQTWHVVAIGGLGALTAGIISLGSSLTPSSYSSGDTEKAGPQVAQAQPCAEKVRERDALSQSDAVLRSAPATNSLPIAKPAQLSRPSEANALATISSEVPLRATCDEIGWSRVRVLPTGLRWMEGWVQTTALRDLTLDANGRRALTSADIEWQAGSERDRTAIVKVANLILRDDKRCEAIDKRSLLVEGSRGARRYTLLCDGPAGAFPVSFTARDAEAQSFSMPVPDPNATAGEPIDKGDAAAACMDAIQPNLQQPNSVDFHTFTDTTFNSDGSRARFTVGFTAKNGLGLEVESTAACIFEGASMLSAEVLPAGSY